MANYSSLISAMEAVIRQNGNQQITGTILQTVLRSVILELGAEFQFGGVATPDTDPNNPDYNVAYIAGAGTYTNFDNQTIPAGKIGIFKNRGAESGTWALQTFDISLGANSVSESNIQNGAVSENKIANNSVSTNKIKNKNVTRNKLSDELIEELDKKANINGFYSTLGAGVAENLVGRGSVPAEYTFRPSGGNADLGSGTAQIKKLMGRTLVWNQLLNQRTIQTDLIKETTSGHKYLLSFVFESGNGTVFIALPNGIMLRTDNSASVAEGHNAHIAESNGADLSFSFTYASGEKFTNVMLFDLTLMFGAGNEPSTVEEFESLFPLDYYAYNEGELLSVTATGIKTVGFNQWDEEWELGSYDSDNGEKIETTNYYRSKNFIRVFPNKDYFWAQQNATWKRINFYDANRNFISYTNGYANSVFTTPANCAYITIWQNGTTYKNDICINLSWSGYRNGEYEAYWESELPIPITTMTGKLNGEGESVVIFPDGACGAGTAYDYGKPDADGVLREVTKVMAKVDLGTLDWSYHSDAGHLYFRANISGEKKPITGSIRANLVCGRYTNDTGDNVYNNTSDKIIAIPADNDIIMIYDSSYSDANTFKAAMLGIYAYYELATPIEYVLDAEQPMNYRVDDFGTEMELPQNDDEPVTAPIRYEVQYAMNAVDTLRRLPENYISKESFEDFLAEFDSKLGAALNATIVSTMTFNAETQKYGFNITITPNP